jgi:hypothetical protein
MFIRFLRDGLRKKGLSNNLLASAVLVILCMYTKETVYVALPIFIVGIAWFVYENKFPLSVHRKIWPTIVIASGFIIVLLVAVLNWGEAASWYRQSIQPNSIRSDSWKAQSGDSVFSLEHTPDRFAQGGEFLQQMLPSKEVIRLRGKEVTLGAWMWSSQDVTVRAPYLSVLDYASGIYQDVRTVQLSTAPVFFAIHLKIPMNASVGWVTINPQIQGIDQVVQIYYDDLVLVEGAQPLGSSPQWQDVKGTNGIWGGYAIKNLIRNASAEGGWPYVRPWVDYLGATFLPDKGHPSMILYALLDWQGTGWYLSATAGELVRTFWGKFGWGHVSLLGSRPYLWLAGITILGVAGFFVSATGSFSNWRWEVIILFGLSFVMIWGMTFIRGVFYLFFRPYLPSARYAYPAIIPTLTILLLGWNYWLLTVEPRLHRSQFRRGMLLIIPLIGLAFYALFSVLTYYYIG